MADSGTYDRWHRSRPDGGRCEHRGLSPSADHGAGLRWQARWRDDSGAQKKRNFRTKAEADAYLTEVKGRLQSGLYIDPAAGKTTVERYGETWRKEQLHRGSTADRVERTLRLHVVPILGRLAMSAVRSHHIQAWVKDRTEVLGPGTLRVAYEVLVAMFARAVLDRVIATSPCAGIRLPERPDTERWLPSTAQVHALAEELPERFRAAVWLAAGCGLRIGEVFGLEVEDVDFLRREIHVRRQVVVVAGQRRTGRKRKVVLGPPKTKTSRRTVELPEVVGEVLAEHIRVLECPAVDVLDETDPRKPQRRQARLLFTSTAGLIMDSTRWAPVWTHARKAVKGVPEDTGAHTLRHWFATRLIHAGASVKTVQLALGHSTPTVTLNTYTHEWPEALDRTRSILDSALRVPDVCPPQAEQGR